ncbi:MAG: hypothetical protein RR620_08825 [Clostridium sp.]
MNKRKKYSKYISLAISLLLLAGFVYYYISKSGNYKQAKFDSNIDMTGENKDNEESNETIRVKNEKKIGDVSTVISKEYEKEIASNFEEGTEQVPREESKSQDPPTMPELPPPTSSKDAITIIPPTEKLEIEDKVIAQGTSGYKRGLQNDIFNQIGEIKTNSNYTPKSFMMNYYSKSDLEKYVNSLVQDYTDNLCVNYEADINREFYYGGKHYRITVMDTWKIAIDNDSARGVLNAIKISSPGFIQATHSQENDKFSYQYGTISIYYDEATVKNIVVMGLYNFAEFD